MNQPLSSPDLGSEVLMQVHEGMDVVDPDDHKVGTVEQVYFGDVDESTERMGKGPVTSGSLPETGANTWVDTLAEVFGDDEDLPEVVRNRLMRSGFIRVDFGILSRDRFALPEHIASVSGDTVRLRVSRDELIEA